MIETVIDISKWQGTMNPSITLESDAIGIIMKAGGVYSNGNFMDVRFEENIKKYNNVLPMGYYFLWEPQAGIDGMVNLVDEIENKLAQWNATMHLGRATDVESNPGMLSKSVVRNNLQAFWDRTETPFVWDVYTRAEFWNNNLGNMDVDTRRLWIAMYNSTESHPWIGSPPSYKPASWDDYWLWQWSADGNAMGASYGASSHSIDMNRVNVETLDEYHQMIGWDATGTVPPPPPPSPCVCGTMVVQTSVLNVRSGPGTSFPVQYQNTFGEVVDVVEINVNQNNVWGMLEDGNWSAIVYKNFTYMRNK